VPGIAGIPLAEARALEFSAVEASIDSLKNARVEAHFSSSGGLVSLVVDGKRVELQEESCLMLYPDVPHLFDAWEIDRQTLDQGEGLTTETIACVEVSDERYEAAVVFTRSLGSASKIVTRYHLRASESVLRVAFDIDWQEPEHLLKLAIPTGYRSGMARFGAPFGSVTRSQLHNGSVAEAQWEVPASRWAVVSDEDGTGLFVVTEAKYGFSCREGALTVSLVRSPLITGCDAMHSSIYPENLLRTEVEHRHTDIGTKVIHLAIGLHHAQMRQSERPAALADVLFAEVLRYQGASVSAGFLRLENAHSLQPAWAKPAADGEAWILRLHETEGARGVAEVRLRPGWEAIRVNAQEQEAERSPTASIHFTPYELISLKIQRTGCP
jgi:alpha-mannosidase